ncbi:hypothetical protein BKA66DRAFT_419516 [Pyrenochaeta sp. MPI-SDFR-AT-0127]|nr:hypothetical protein BKA66DRAFT_419516 [Pyrenochaeta sp. MPI-SDFR-AT-0127]
MSSKLHSQTVRGTLDNPKTQEAMVSNKAVPQLGDPISLKPDPSVKKISVNNSDPLPKQDNSTRLESASTTSHLNHNKESAPSADKNSKDNRREDELPHSKKVRGTLSHGTGKTLDTAQLGDPTSLKAETSKTEMGKDVEREGQDKTMKSKL